MAAQPERLLLRGFPHWLTTQEKESLLTHFGATGTVVMPTRGKMRNAVFATFSTHEDAKRALEKLHQVQLFQSRLVVEYARDKHSGQLQDSGPDSVDTEQSARDTAPSPEPEVVRHPPPLSPPRLHYHYPPPTPSTLTNITNTLACVPKFYVQVLHLMNLMNLPPPFGPATPTPPLAAETILSPNQEGEGEEEEGEAESEMESDEEIKRPPSIKLAKPVREVKHRAAHLRPSKGASPPAKRKKHEESDQFDQIIPLLPAKRIELHVPSEIKPHPQDHTPVTIVTGSDIPILPPPTVIATGGRGEGGGEAGKEKEEGMLVGEREEEEGEEEEEVEEERMRFITSHELKDNRISKSEMRELSVFRGYSAGEPSLRLYLKNLAKQVTEQDLRYIYGRYVNWNSEEERNIFDIRLMQTGRMKGQAFVGLPSEEAAIAAVRETNGYLLAGRPMVVHFARTAKAIPS